MITSLCYGEALGRYGFPNGHPLSVDRLGAFSRETVARGLDKAVTIVPPRQATRNEIERFHTPQYVDLVLHAEARGLAYLDQGDTPVFPGVYDAAATVVGTALDGLDRVMTGASQCTFQPIGGLHHARRDRASGFCVFNDVGVVIETLRSRYNVTRVAYVDIDVHYGDGVYDGFETDPAVIIADIHESGQFLFPGTGYPYEIGKGAAEGTKLNIPLDPGEGDAEFMRAWPRVGEHVRRFSPEFYLLQCGADGLEGDPLAHLTYSASVHAHAARSLCALAHETAHGRLMAFGGGGYNGRNIAMAWNTVLQELVKAG